MIDRLRPEVPVPQDLVHLDQLFHCESTQLMGHALLLQFLASIRMGHGLPP
jgi:hypothetical protein